MARALSQFAPIFVMVVIFASAIALNANPPILRSSPILSISSRTAGTTATGTIEGISPPVVTGDDASANVVIRLNGWVEDTPDLVWSDESQTWVFKIDIPPGMEGATISITVIGADGSLTTMTFTIR